MPRRAETGSITPRIPRLSVHKASGLRRARFNGRDLYFGPPGDADGTARYKRTLAEYLANSGMMPLTDAERRDLTVTELIARYWVDMKKALNPESLPPIKRSIKQLRRLYGDTFVAEFGPTQFKAVRAQMIGLGWSRNFINEAGRRIRTVFHWGVGVELVDPSIPERLRRVRALRHGEGGAETDPIKPVDQQTVEKTLPFLPPDVKAMVQLQLFTGARPGEIRRLRWSEIDMTGPVWLYRPRAHKTAHHNKQRTIRFGPRAQEILMMFKDRNADAPLFSPEQSEMLRRQQMRAARKTPVQPSQEARARLAAKSAAKRKRRPSKFWTRKAYRRAIERACKRAGVDHWHPHQLRHTFADFTTRTDSLDLAGILLDHSSLRTTLAYTDTDTQRANAFALKYG